MPVLGLHRTVAGPALQGFFSVFFWVYVLIFFKTKDDLAVIFRPVLWLHGLVDLMSCSAFAFRQDPL